MIQFYKVFLGLLILIITQKSLMLQTERHKKASQSSLKNRELKNNPLFHISPNIFPAFSTKQQKYDQKYRTAKPTQERAKGKQNKKNKKTFNVKKQQFPCFAIRFKEESIESQRDNQIETDRFNSKHESLQSFGNFQTERLNRNAGIQQKNELKPTQWRNIQSNISNKIYMTDFKQAIQKIFKSLDVFNRGKISETNINKWIPQSSLYFLGRVFQRIRQKRLTLSLTEFQEHCLLLLYQSAEQDVKWFLSEVNGRQPQIEQFQQVKSNHHKKSQNYNNTARKIDEQKIWNSNKSNKVEPIQFQRVIKQKEDRRRNLNIRPPCFGQKASFKKQLHIHPPKQFSFFQPHISFATKADADKQQRKEYLTSRGSNQKSKSRNNIQLNSIQQVPNFTFQLSKPINFAENQKGQVKSIASTPKKPEFVPTIGNSSQQKKSSLIVRQSLPKQGMNISMNSSRRSSSVDPQQAEKMDKLSNRLEQYLKFNQQKIEKFNRFIKENNTPRK